MSHGLTYDLMQILPPKMPFFVRQKVQISSKILPQIPNFANFIKNQYFRHDGQLSSFRQFFVKNEILCSLVIIQQLIKNKVTLNLLPITAKVKILQHNKLDANSFVSVKL